MENMCLAGEAELVHQRVVQGTEAAELWLAEVHPSSCPTRVPPRADGRPPRQRRCVMRRRWVMLTLTILLPTILGVLSWSMTTELWDGGFPQTRFQLTVVDSNDTPVPGVTMVVE